MLLSIVGRGSPVNKRDLKEMEDVDFQKMIREGGSTLTEEEIR